MHTASEAPSGVLSGGRALPSSPSSPFSRPLLVLRIARALAIANARYWPSVAIEVRAQLRRWREEADRISDPGLRGAALQKLEEERFNAEVAGTLATLARRPERAWVVEAIVALEVLFDHLDGLSEGVRGETPSEAASGDRLGEARGILEPLLETLPRAGARSLEGDRGTAFADDGYSAMLAETVRFNIERLPSAGAIAQALSRAAHRCVEGQAHAHALPFIGAERVKEWAQAQAEGSPLRWREYLGGAASSVLAMHALIAASAREGLSEREASMIDELYLSIGVMSTTLDSVIDRAGDLSSGAPMHVSLYEDPSSLADALIAVAEDAIDRSRGVPDQDHHLMTLVGVIAYYLSAPVEDPFAITVRERMTAGLSGALAGPLRVMAIWRGAKRLRSALSR